MLPVQELFGGRITIIRPMILLEGPKVTRAGRRLGVREFPNPCPEAENSQRARIRGFLKEFYRKNPKVRGNIFRGLTRIHPELIVPAREDKK